MDSPQKSAVTNLGVDIAPDNVEECRKNLLVWAGAEADKACIEIVEHNIIQGDSVKYSVDDLPEHTSE